MVDPKRLDELEKSGEINRYEAATPVIGELRKAGYSDESIKNIMWHIAENGLNYKKIDLVANRRQLDKDPQMQAVIARMYFDDRKRRGLNYDKFEDVHKALAPQNRNPQDRIALLEKAGWRKPEDADLYAWSPAIEPPVPAAPLKPIAVPVSSIKSKINKDGTLDTTPPSR